MNSKKALTYAVVALCVILPGRPLTADDLTQTGNITINPDSPLVELRLLGRTFDNVDTGPHGLSITSNDIREGGITCSNGSFTLLRPNGSFQWQYQIPDQTKPDLAMSLDEYHVLTLLDPDGLGNDIVLIPGAGGGITFGGVPLATAANSHLAGLTVTGATQVDTLSATGATHLTTFSASGAAQLTTLSASGATQLTTLSASGAAQLTNLSATGATQLTTLSTSGAAQLASATVSGTLAVGSNASATGSSTVAMGANAVAAIGDAAAIGESAYAESNSFSIGRHAHAVNSAIAIGNEAIAAANSIALGH